MDKNYKQYLPKINFTLEVLLEGLRSTNLRIDNISGGGGGSQDLQSVLDNGNSATCGFNNYIKLFKPNILGLENQFCLFDSTTNDQTFIQQSTSLISLETVAGNGDDVSSINLLNDQLSLTLYTRYSGDLVNTTINFESPTVSSNIKIPAKTVTGTYILATLDDILKIDLNSRVYADNAAAISGGLVAKDLYRTVGGELRIVV